MFQTIYSIHNTMRLLNPFKNPEEWIGRPRIAAAEFNYKEVDRWLQEQFIHGINNNDVLIEIIHRLTAMKDTSIETTKQILAWARWFEAQRLQTAIFESSRET